MEKLKKYDIMYMDLAKRIASMSYAVRLKVGSICVKDDRIISMGWNGTPAGFDNCCEYLQNDILITRSEVIHAEQNSILKLAKHGESGMGATLYVTCSPCYECSKMIIQAGIKRVVYEEEYRIIDGIDLLRKANITVEKL